MNHQLNLCQKLSNQWGKAPVKLPAAASYAIVALATKAESRGATCYAGVALATQVESLLASAEPPAKPGRNPPKPKTPFLPVASHRASWRRRVIILAVIIIGIWSNCSAEEPSAFTMTDDGFFQKGDFKVTMAADGGVDIFSEGRHLAKNVMIGWDPAGTWIGVMSGTNAVVLIDKDRQEVMMKFRRDFGGGIKMTWSRMLRVKGGTVELITTAEMSENDGKEYPLPHGARADTFIEGPEYEGGRWQIGVDESGTLVTHRTEPEHGRHVLEPVPADSAFSFWQKGKERGFTIWPDSIRPRSIYFSDYGGKGKVCYHVESWDTSGKKIAQVIEPAFRSTEEIQIHTIRAAEEIRRFNIAESINFPVKTLKTRMGYLPAGYSLPVEVTIASGKGNEGEYIAEFLLLDQEDKEILKERKKFIVTGEKAGETRFDFVTPEQCALYWMRVNVKDRADRVLISSDEYPFAVTVRLPELKDVPETSPLGGAPMAGGAGWGAMPEGRLVGMKWDRFWSNDTSWPAIEPAKGKFNWKKCDQMVEEAVSNGCSILWCLCQTADWASSLPRATQADILYNEIKGKYPVAPGLKEVLEENARGPKGLDIFRYSLPRDIRDWENFVRTIVRRYKDRVHYWQVWNEPWWGQTNLTRIGGGLFAVHKDKNDSVTNLTGFTTFGGFYTDDYMNIVKSASKIIHEEDPAAKVVVFGDYGVRDELGRRRDNSFEEFYKTGIGEYIDILCLHYFLEFEYYRRVLKKRSPARPPEGEDIICQHKDTHYRYTGKNIPVWDTESGWYKCSTYGRINYPPLSLEQAASWQYDGDKKTGWYSSTEYMSRRPLTQEQCERQYGEQTEAGRWFSMISEHRNACLEVQAVLLALSRGISKVFLFAGHGVSVGGPGQYRLPTEKGIAWAAMASVVGTMAKAEYCCVGNDDLCAVTITDISGKKTSVIWALVEKRKVPVVIPVGEDKSFKGMDFLGNPITLKSRDGLLAFDASEELLYIYGLDLRDIFSTAEDFNFISLKEEPGVAALYIDTDKANYGEVEAFNPFAKYSMDCTLEAEVEPAGKIEFKKQVRLSPGERKKIPFSLTLEKDEDTRSLKFELRRKDVVLGRAAKTYRISKPISKAPGRIDVDGDTQDWKGVQEFRVDSASRVLIGLETPGLVGLKAPERIWQGAKDLSFTVKTCWTEREMYFLVEVHDDVVLPGKSPSYKWDSVEFFMDIRNGEAQKRQRTEGALTFLVQPVASEKPRECNVQFAGNDGAYMKVFFIGRKTKDGYVMEGSVIPKTFGLAEGLHLGLDIAVNDGKEPNAEGKAERKSQMIWLGAADNWRDTSGWGRFYLRR